MKKVNHLKISVTLVRKIFLKLAAKLFWEIIFQKQNSCMKKIRILKNNSIFSICQNQLSKNKFFFVWKKTNFEE
jgi:hypothetical protein